MDFVIRTRIFVSKILSLLLPCIRAGHNWYQTCLIQKTGFYEESFTFSSLWALSWQDRCSRCWKVFSSLLFWQFFWRRFFIRSSKGSIQSTSFPGFWELSLFTVCLSPFSSESETSFLRASCQSSIHTRATKKGSRRFIETFRKVFRRILIPGCWAFSLISTTTRLSLKISALSWMSFRF